MSAGALVTGAARGLGLEIARVVARRGLVVHVTDLDLEAAEHAASQLGGGAFASALDVRDDQACRAAAALTAERAGSLELWVNNAGVLVTGPAWEQSEETRRLMVEVNALGTVNGTLFDKLDDPAAAASFSGVLLKPEQVAEAVGRLVDRPRPVTILPRRRGPLIRAIDLWPRAGLWLIGPALAAGRLEQRRMRRKLSSR